MNAFIEPLTATLGWSRGDIGAVMSVPRCLGPCPCLMLSSLSLRMSAAALTLGALTGGLSIISLGHIHSLPLFTAAFSLAWISGQAFGGAVANILISNWFKRYQGRAFGLCNIGTSLSGAIMPFVLMLLIEHFDVRTAWTIYGCAVLCAAPICWLLVRDTPAMLGLHADNTTANRWSTAKSLFSGKILRIPAVYFRFRWLGPMVGSAVMSQPVSQLGRCGFGLLSGHGLHAAPPRAGLAIFVGWCAIAIIL